MSQKYTLSSTGQQLHSISYRSHFMWLQGIGLTLIIIQTASIFKVNQYLWSMLKKIENPNYLITISLC